MKMKPPHLAVVAAFASLMLPIAQARAADVVDTAVAAGNFTTLVTAVKAAGLTETLKGAGPFTLFAPTDAAFAALPQGTVATLLKPENKAKLVSILTYHVLAGRVMAADIAGKTLHPKTLEGERLTIVGTTTNVTVNGATVTKADIAADNGVIHAIDKVLMPQ